MQNVLKKPIKVPQIMIGEEPILDYFLENESKFSDLNYLITYKNYLRKEKSDYSNESEFLVYEGSKAIIPHLSRGKRYFGKFLARLHLPPEHYAKEVFFFNK
jgi:hypothetical protein